MGRAFSLFVRRNWSLFSSRSLAGKSDSDLARLMLSRNFRCLSNVIIWRVLVYSYSTKYLSSSSTWYILSGMVDTDLLLQTLFAYLVLFAVYFHGFQKVTGLHKSSVVQDGKVVAIISAPDVNPNKC